MTAAEQEKRIAELRAELARTRNQRAGYFSGGRVHTTSAGTLALSEMIGGLCVIGVVLGWVTYVVDWDRLLTIKDSAVQRMREKLGEAARQRKQTQQTQVQTQEGSSSAAVASQPHDSTQQQPGSN